MLTRQRLQWGFSMLLSRLARLESREGLECCVPWADMLNHAADASCHLDWNPGELFCTAFHITQIDALRCCTASEAGQTQ